MALELSAHVARWRGEHLLTGRSGGQLTPAALEHVFRAARQSVDGLPDRFRYHDLRHASAKTTLDTYCHLWPDRDDSTRATIEAVFIARETELELNQGDGR